MITICPPPQIPRISGAEPESTYLSIRIRDQGGGVSPANMARIFSYAFTTAGRGADRDDMSEDEGGGGGPYAAQHVGGSAAVGVGGSGEANMFGEIAGKGLQTGMGTIAGLGYGLPMSKLYARCARDWSRLTSHLRSCYRYFGGSLDLFSLEGWGKFSCGSGSIYELITTR